MTMVVVRLERIAWSFIDGELLELGTFQARECGGKRSTSGPPGVDRQATQLFIKEYVGNR